MGAVHQDEVTFVMGQPNFMEDGSCCGRWGLSEGQEGCQKVRRCTACYNTTFGEGYKAYFNDKEFEFAKRMGAWWTNFAASGSPNSRGGSASNASTSSAWPVSSKGGVVLSADLPNGYTTEAELYNDPAVCQLWNES